MCECVLYMGYGWQPKASGWQPGPHSWRCYNVVATGQPTRAARPARYDRPADRVLTTTEMWVICTCVCARARKCARAKHVGSLRIMAQMPAILNVCSRYLALFCVFLQARKKGRGGKKTLNGHCLDPYQVLLEIILISSPIGYASITIDFQKEMNVCTYLLFKLQHPSF